MNYYFNTLQNITQSVDELLNVESNSIEIKQSATNLRGAVQPCIAELQQSAIRLNQLILLCSDELYHAENAWLSKQKIVEAKKHEIWEQIGEISGCHTKIFYIGIQCKTDALKQAKKSWERKIQYLINRYYFNTNGQAKTGISWSDKERFINEIKPIVNCQCTEVFQLVKKNLEPVHKELRSIHLEVIQNYVSLLDQKKKTETSKRIELITSKIQTKFVKDVEHLPNNRVGYHIGLRATVGADLKALLEQGWGDIYLEDVVKFKDKVSSKIDKFVSAVFDDRIELATEATAEAIKFYNDFLEQQERYQQEALEQRNAEKAWIDLQRQELSRIKDGIHVILSGS